MALCKCLLLLHIGWVSLFNTQNLKLLVPQDLNGLTALELGVIGITILSTFNTNITPLHTDWVTLGAVHFKYKISLISHYGVRSLLHFRDRGLISNSPRAASLINGDLGSQTKFSLTPKPMSIV